MCEKCETKRVGWDAYPWQLQNDVMKSATLAVSAARTFEGKLRFIEEVLLGKHDIPNYPDEYVRQYLGERYGDGHELMRYRLGYALMVLNDEGWGEGGG